MDQREYDWQVGDLADQRIYPDERYMQPPPSEADLAQQAREAAAYRLSKPYQAAAARPPESNRLTAVAGAIGSIPGAIGELAAIPGRTMAPNPYPPGSEEADFYERARKSATYQKAPEMALNLAGTGTPFAAPGSLGMFGGKLSKTADLDAMRKAEEMVQYGKNPVEIRKETNWFPTAGGILKYEIPDYRTGWTKGQEPSKILRSNLPAASEVGRAYRHPELFEAYPDLAKTPLVISSDLGRGTRGGYQPPLAEGDTGKIFIAPGSAKDMRNVLLHEGQHVLQDIENWPIGGNPARPVQEGTPQWDIYQRMLKEASAPISREAYSAMIRDMGVSTAPPDAYEKYLKSLEKGFSLPPDADKKFRRMAAYEGYNRSAGEVEARNVQARRDFTAAQREATPPHISQDVPYPRQIVEYREPRPPASEQMGALADLQLSQEKPVGFAPGSGKGVIGDLFDYSKVHKVPDVKQFDLPRYEPPRGVSERVQSLVGNKKVEQKMLDYIEKGKDIHAETFYYNEPLRQAFIDELGKKKGEPAFARYMDYVAATSPRSDVETNARNASYYYWLERQGKPVPPQGGVNPQPYGHMAQNLHRENAEKIRSGEYFDVVNNPKPLSFSQNLQGNFAPVTVDAHAFKLPAILARDPEFLAGSLKLEKGAPTINPTKMYEAGDLTMREAAQRPVYWAARPNRNEYGAMEQYYKRLAQEAGMTPAQTQAAAWAGGGKVTGLESVAGDPFMRAVENRAIKTAAERGITPEEALSQMMRGKAPLLGLGGAAVMGGLASQDEYQ